MNVVAAFPNELWNDTLFAGSFQLISKKGANFSQSFKHQDQQNSFTYYATVIKTAENLDLVVWFFLSRVKPKSIWWDG